MSAPRRTVVLSPEAQVDYDDILLHGLLTWGDEQTRRYQIALDHVIDQLGHYPETGETTSAPVAAIFPSNGMRSTLSDHY